MSRIVSALANRLAEKRSDFALAVSRGMSRTALMLDGKWKYKEHEGHLDEGYEFYEAVTNKDKAGFINVVRMVEEARNPGWAFELIGLCRQSSFESELTKRLMLRLTRVIINGEVAEWAFGMIEKYDKRLRPGERHTLVNIVLRKGTKSEMHILWTGYSKISERQRGQLKRRYREIEKFSHLKKALADIRKEYGRNLLSQALQAGGFLNELDF